MTTEWYNNHQNLCTLAEWLREHHGWNFCKDNLLDVLEKPWKWEKEWKLANGDVHFVLVERPGDDDDEFLSLPGSGVDTTQCEWCGLNVGFVTFRDEQGARDIEWVTVYHDDNSGNFACDDCAGMASNFAETVVSTPAMESPIFPKLILVKDDMPGHPHNPAVFPLAWEPPVEVKLERCIHCGKVLHREMHDGHDFLVDDETGGDVCGSYGTFGNEPHVSDVAS